MISFINKFLSALNDDELKYLSTQLWKEEENRLKEKASKIGVFIELSAEEKNLIDNGKYINAIKLYKVRNNVSLREAKIVADQYRDNL